MCNYCNVYLAKARVTPPPRYKLLIQIKIQNIEDPIVVALNKIDPQA